MTTLLGRSPKDSFQELLKLDNTSAGVDSTLRAIQDGTGNSTPLQLSTTQIALNGALWPTSVGTSGQVLTAGSSGSLSWATPVTGMTYKGTWNATTNTPTLTSGSGTTGAMYKVTTASTVVTQTLKNAQSGGGTQLFLNSSTGIVPGMAIYYGATFLGIVSTASGGNVVSVATMNYSNISGSMTFTTYLNGLTTFNVGDYVFFDGAAWEIIPGSNSAPVTSVFGRTGAVALASGDVTTALTYTPVNPAAAALTGTPTAPTATAGTNTTQIATTAFVAAAAAAVSGSGVAPNTTIVSATLSSTYNIGTTSNIFYNFTASSVQVVFTPAANTLPQGWTTTVYLNPTTSTSTSLTLGSNGSDYFLQTGNAVSNVTILLGYAYKITAIPSLNRFLVDVAATLQSADVTKALGFTPANIASPTFTGAPAAPTANAGTNTTQLATTAFVSAAVSAATPNLSTYAPLASPALTGSPTAPTATAGTNTTQLATTAFVASAVSTAVTAAGVASFNTRTGAVTLTSSDVTTALGTTSTITASDYETSLMSITDNVTGDQNFSKVTTLSHFDGLASNATSYVDVIGNTVTVVSGATFSSSVTKFGSGSVFFNGSGALTMPAAVSDVQGGDFTIEAWIYPTLNSAAQKSIVSNGYNIQFYLNGLTTQFYISTNNSASYSLNLTSSSSVGLNTWNHVAATRQGNVFTLWINGVNCGATTVALGTIATSSYVTCIGSDYAGSYIAPFTGYMDDIRITKGVARYTGSFSVPTAAFPNNAGVSATRVGVRSSGALQFGTTTGAGNTSFTSVGQIDSTGLNGMAIGATTPASITAAGRLQSDAYSYTIATLGGSGTQTINLSAASEFTATITASTTFAFTNTLATNLGQVVYLRLVNAGAAGVNISWPASTKFSGGTAPTFTAAGVDLLGVMYDFTTTTYMVFVIGLNVS